MRLAAQRILATHLRTPPDTPAEAGVAVPAGTLPKDHWADIDVDLTGATLIDFDFTDCQLHTAALNPTGVKFAELDVICAALAILFGDLSIGDQLI